MRTDQELPFISLNVRTNLYIGQREIAEKLVSKMLEFGGIFVPQKFDIGKEEGRPLKLPFEENIDEAIAAMSEGEFPGLVAERKRPVKVFYDFIASQSDMFDQIDVMVEASWFKDSGNLGKFLAFARDIYSLVEASSGYVKNGVAEQRYDTVRGYRGQTFFSEPRFPGVRDNLPGLFWANFLGPEYVEMWGRRFLLKAPCHRIEELPDGGLVLLLAETPLVASEPSYGAAKFRLHEYLGYEAFDGRRYPKFRTTHRWRKKRNARPLVQTGGILDDVFADEPTSVATR